MRYFKINEDTYIQFDETNMQSRTIIVSQLQSDIESAKQRLSEIPGQATDQELLDWARVNYVQTDYSVEKQSLQNMIAQDQAILDALP